MNNPIYLYANAVDLLKGISNDTTCPMHIAAEIEEILEQLVMPTPWRKASDRLPKEERQNYIAEMKAAGTLDIDLYPCLVVKAAPDAPAKRIIKKAWFDGHGFIDADCIHITRCVTHWMPLPELPPLEGGQ